MRQTIKLLLLLFLVSCSTSKDTPQATTIPQKKSNVDELLDIQLKHASGHYAKNSVLLLLPLSGSNEVIGKGILNACIMSARENNSEIDFFALDTANPEIEKSKLYGFKNKKLKAIIGPLFFHEAKQYGALFSNVPILSLSNNLKINNDHVIACGLSPQDEIKALFSFSKSQKIDTFVVILPEGELGDQILEFVQKELKSQNMEEGEDVEIIRYTSISSKNATKYAKNSGKKAVFVIEPILITSKLKDMHIFTLSSAAMTEIEAWEGAIFAFVDNQEQQEFIQKYEFMFGKTPTIFDIIGYDIANAVQNSIANDNSLLENKFIGCLGEFSIKKNIGIKRKLKIFRMENAQKIEISENDITSEEPAF